MIYIIAKRTRRDESKALTVGSPPMQHDNFEIAAKEARRLAGLYPNQEFVIFEGKALVHTPKPPVVLTYLGEER